MRSLSFVLAYLLLNALVCTSCQKVIDFELTFPTKTSPTVTPAPEKPSPKFVLKEQPSIGPSQCSQDGWCHYLPQGTTLYQVRGSASNNVWAVGEDGAALHWNGSTWTAVSTGTTQNLWDVWTDGPNNAWVVGEGPTVLHWDGASWSPVLAPGTATAFFGLAGQFTDDLWLVGTNGTALHWDGSTWSSTNTGVTTTLRSVWMNARNDVWAAGDQGTILRWNGSRWTVNSSPIKTTLRSIWGSGPNNMWMVGEAGIIVHWDGTAWLSVAIPNIAMPEYDFFRVWGSDPDNLWIVYNESTEPFQHTGTFHFDGHRWNNDWVGNINSLSTARHAAIWGSSLADLWVVGVNLLTHFDGQTWTDVAPSTINDTLYSIWGTSFNDIWAIRIDVRSLVHFDGQRWSRAGTQCSLPGSSEMYSVSGSGPKDVWAVGRECTIHWDGISWQVVESHNAFAFDRIRVFSPENVWLMGTNSATLKHWDGTKWSSLDLPKIGSVTPRDLWTVGANKLWVVGASSGTYGALFHYDGSNWHSNELKTGGSGPLESIWGSEDGKLWAAGEPFDVLKRDQAAIYYFDGATWSQSPETVPNSGSVRAIWGSSSSDVWAIGHEGPRLAGIDVKKPVILHFDGNSWSTQESGVHKGLWGISGASKSQVWIVGDDGSLLFRQ